MSHGSGWQRTTRASAPSNRALRRKATTVLKGRDAMTAQLQELATQYQHTLLFLMSTLAQIGGTITVTRGTVDQIIANVARVSYVVEPNAAKTEFLVKLVEQESIPEDEPAQEVADVAESV